MAKEVAAATPVRSLIVVVAPEPAHDSSPSAATKYSTRANRRRHVEADRANREVAVDDARARARYPPINTTASKSALGISYDRPRLGLALSSHVPGAALKSVGASEVGARAVRRK